MDHLVVPTISSSCAGPLGILHLPRLWLKISLHAAGRLPAGYRHGVGGFDERLCTNLGIDRDAFVAYIEQEKPTYLELEAWVREHATKLDAESIAAHNRAIMTGEMPAEIANERRRDAGVTDLSLTRAVALNDLDDWAAIHRQITTSAPA
ncbi:MAG TPA: DUF5069 domain-containing protein [Candidatus Limnocylindria bacterium]|jgi:hypothetical protein|nr:DUF5069 domain-containing protein [Candidatus Limnocylindria bacterium]